MRAWATNVLGSSRNPAYMYTIPKMRSPEQRSDRFNGRRQHSQHSSSVEERGGSVLKPPKVCANESAPVIHVFFNLLILARAVNRFFLPILLLISNASAAVVHISPFLAALALPPWV